jgi:hypothetical protein
LTKAAQDLETFLENGGTFSEALKQLAWSKSALYRAREELGNSQEVSQHPTYGPPLWSVETPAGLLVCFAKSDEGENFSEVSEEGREEMASGRRPWTAEDTAASDRMERLYALMKEKGLV